MLQKVEIVGTYTNKKTTCNMYVNLSKKLITNHLLIHSTPSSKKKNQSGTLENSKSDYIIDLTGVLKTTSP